MEKVTIEKIYTKERLSKDGKPFTSLAIITKEHGTRWISGFKNDITKNWKEGDVVEITITQNGEYLNFEAIEQEVKNDSFIKDEFMVIRKTEYEFLKNCEKRCEFLTSPTDGFENGIDLARHPLNSESEQKSNDDILAKIGF